MSIGYSGSLSRTWDDSWILMYQHPYASVLILRTIIGKHLHSSLYILKEIKYLLSTQI